MRLLLFTLFSVLLFGACEKVIQLPLNDANTQVVIEASLNDQIEQSVIKISRSGNVYENSDFETVEDAFVKVNDSEGEVFVFNHEEGGVYKDEDFIVVPGRRYDLRVELGDDVFTSSSQSRSKPKLDSVTYSDLAGTFGIPVDNIRYLVSFHSIDNVDERNFYLLNIYRNGRKNSGYYLGNDDFINGQYYTASFFGVSAKPSDTVLVEMLSMDEPVYNFWVGLSGNIDEGPFSAAPANPPSNIKGGALGVFGVYTTDSLSIIMPS